MARSVNQIFNNILASIQTNPILSTELTSTSDASYWQLWAYIMSVALNNEELINDQFITANETYLSSNPPANQPWIYKYVKSFQYSSTSPQTVQLNETTFIPSYPIINTSLQIIAAAAISAPFINSGGTVVGTPGLVQVKVCTGNPGSYIALSGPQLSSLQTYLNIIKPAGIVYKAISVPGDLVMVNLFVYYDGSYSGTIQTTVYNAYINYISSIPFNGIFRVSDLEFALKLVPGVIDIEMININYRASSTPFTIGVYNIINNYTQLQRDSSLYALAGFIIDETTTNYGFQTINSGNFIAV